MIVSRETTQLSPPLLDPVQEPIVSRETIARLQHFETLVLKWNRHINLISRKDEPRLWERHILDSLQLLPLLPSAGRLVDLGSGAGLPGLVLAIASERPITLIESDSRKAAFLREAARETAAEVTVLVCRIEEAPHVVDGPRADIITARALAPLPRLLELAVPLLAPAGICIFPKGASADQELTACGAAWNMTVERHPSRIDPQGCILRLSEVSRV